jgi:23S rRNA (guanosine2251-2'-O)-methyltransferase
MNIFGRQPVHEALLTQLPVLKIFLAQGAKGPGFAKIIRLAEERRIPMQSVNRNELDRMVATDKHQGIAAQLPPLQFVDWDKMLERAAKRNEKAALVLLDGVEDPRNLGAILRVAEGSGMHGVILTKHRSAEITPATIKTSAGAAFHMPIGQVNNLATAMEEMKHAGLWLVGCDASGDKNFDGFEASLPLGLVLGGEGKGLHRLVREKCDFLVRIPMRGKVSSLNVATAAAVIFYEVVRQRSKAN